MALRSLALHNFRLFRELRLQLEEAWTWIVGPNGSGKTSILEAIYLLSRGRSFRTSNLRELIRWGAEQLAVSGESDLQLAVLLSARERHLKVGGKRVRRRAELARYLAVQLIAPPLYELLCGSPSERRRFLDWGLFYGQPGYLEVWRSYRRVLRQRNAALKRRERTLPLWNRAFLEKAIIINEYRRCYLERFSAELAREIERLGFKGELEARYLQGWPHHLSLEEALERDRKRDLERGYTHSGPHRGDFFLLLDGRPVAGQLSRGQMKLWTSCMAVVQASLPGRSATLLIDDLAAELDPDLQERFWNMVHRFPGQRVIAVLDETLPNRFGGRCFRL